MKVEVLLMCDNRQFPKGDCNDGSRRCLSDVLAAQSSVAGEMQHPFDGEESAI
jgi:hypothetical protein